MTEKAIDKPFARMIEKYSGFEFLTQNLLFKAQSAYRIFHFETDKIEM